MVRGKYRVGLTPEQRNQLQHLIRAGKGSVRVIIRARILLKTDEGWTAPQVAEALDVAEGTVFRIKRRFAEAGLKGVLKDRPPSPSVPEVGRPGRSPPHRLGLLRTAGRAMNTGP